MTHLTGADIVSRVRRTINEARVNDSEFYTGADESELDSIIAAHVLEALNFVHGTADPDLLDAGETATHVTGTRELGSYFVGVVAVPGYLRLKSLRVQGWSKALTEMQSDEEDEYAKQSDPYACGTPERPAAFLSVNLENGERQIELYSLPKIDSSVRVEYMTFVEDTGADDGIDVSAKLEDAYIYYLSGLVLTVLNDQHADDMFNLAMALMGVSAQEKQEKGGV